MYGSITPPEWYRNINFGGPAPWTNIQKACMRRRVLLTIFKYLFSSRKYSYVQNMQILPVMASYTQPSFDQIWRKKIYQPICIRDVWYVAERLSHLHIQHSFQTSISPKRMQIFANGKQPFHSVIEFYVIHLKMKGGNLISFWSLIRRRTIPGFSFVCSAGYISRWLDSKWKT